MVEIKVHPEQMSSDQALAFTAFTALAWYFALEIIFRGLWTFKKFKGLYFWSLMVSSLGIILHAVAFLVKFFELRAQLVGVLVLITIGWWFMVTGQSLVLYSRLHLVTVNRQRVRWVLYMIMVDAVLFHLPTTVLTFGSNITKHHSWEAAFSVMEKIQMTAFSTQEILISLLYAWETRKMLKPRETFQKKSVLRVMRHLIYINVIIILLDITMLSFEYKNEYILQATIKPAIYGFKLRLEYPILNQLTALLTSGGESSFGTHGRTNGSVVTSSIPPPGRAYSAFAAKNQGPPPDPQALESGLIHARTEVSVSSSVAHKENASVDSHDYAARGVEPPIPAFLDGPPLNKEASSSSLASSQIELTKIEKESSEFR